MIPSELMLWTKIQNFPFDPPDSHFTFSDRVARENGWTKAYTLRVIKEYKKFIYLCCISEKGVTPSDPVDQVWHLHLTYTRSYWIDFCRNTLQKEIHHNPTKGGTSEAEKFDEYYTRLKELYNTHFDVKPPDDIWQNNSERFSDIDFQRVNLKKHWIIRKPGRNSLIQAMILMIGMLGLLFIRAYGNAFLVLLVISIIAALAYNVSKNIDNKSDNRNSDGCNGGAGCSSGKGHHDGNSGCSGCSGSGCSGCGGD